MIARKIKFLFELKTRVPLCFETRYSSSRVRPLFFATRQFTLDRLSRYEATLWRQAGRMLFALEKLDRRKPQERARRVWFGTGE
jgi:hypothetical protein